MANTATTSSVLDQSSDAGFRNWIAEIINTFTSTLTVTQTADTGQINTTTVTRPGVANTSAGYVILRFNDTLQATSPVFIKLEFGCGNTTPTSPQMWLTIGTGSNGSGTITGTAQINRMAVCYPSGTSSSNVTSYTSRFVYNATYGFMGMAWKLNGNGTSTACYGGFQIFRSNDNTGAATGDAIHCMTNFYNSSGTTNSMGYLQTVSYLTTAVYPPVISNGNQWMTAAGTSNMPYSVTSTSFSGNAQVFPVVYMTPTFAFSAYVCYGLLSEQPLGSTFTCAVVGSTTLTFLSIGQPWGSSYLGQNSTSTVGLHMLWQ